jgi:hypothetical protein
MVHCCRVRAATVAMLACSVCLADDAEQTAAAKASLEAALRAGLAQDADALRPALHPDVIACDPTYGVMDLDAIIAPCDQPGGKHEATIGEWSPEVRGQWAAFRIPLEGPCISSAGLSITSVGLAFRDAETWRVVGLGTAVIPEKEGALPEPFAGAYSSGKDALPDFLKRVDDVVERADSAAVRDLSHPKARFIGYNPETKRLEVLDLDERIAIAERYHPKEVTFERVPGQDDIEVQGSQVAFVIRTYRALGTPQPVRVREAFLLWWPPDEARWQILASAYAILPAL